MPALPHQLNLRVLAANMEGVKLSDDFSADASKLLDHVRKQHSFSYNYDYTIRISKFYIPSNTNPSFTGRQTDLLDLYSEMIGNLNKSV